MGTQTFSFFPRENPEERASVERNKEEVRKNTMDNTVETLICELKIWSDKPVLSAF